jgi:LDH2 family malate/lactate/ureidoglycolate dehydrogenase
MYVERMLDGVVPTATEPAVIHDGGSTVVLDARNALGPLSADWSIPMVSERAREHGLACIAVRNGADFGTAAFWARQIAEAGLIGIVMANRRATKAAPGATERLTGNNALAIALPSTEPQPFVMDLDREAAPRDPASAIAALFAANIGVKGFGLAAAIDLLCGGLSGGPLGPQADTFGCSQLFMAIDPARFGIGDLGKRVAEFSARMRTPSRERDDECLLEPELVARLRECAARIGVQTELR